MIGGEMASPREWMMRIFKAKPLARTEGCVTLARIVLVGPVLKNRQKTAKKTKIQAYGKGVARKPSSMGKPNSMAIPEARKYDPENRGRNQSPTSPPESVANKPATAVIIPKSVRGPMPASAGTFFSFK